MCFRSLLFVVWATVCGGCGTPYQKESGAGITILSEPRNEFLPAEELSVLVWNIHKGVDGKFEAAFAEQLEGNHLALIQEAYLDPQGDEARSRVQRAFSHKDDGFRWEVATSFRYGNRPGKPITGVATGSLAMPLRSKVSRSTDTEFLVGTPKTTLFSWFPVRDSEAVVLVINIHGLNRLSFDGFKEQMKVIDDVLSNHSGPLLLGGDFNTMNKKRTDVLDCTGTRHHLRRLSFPPDCHGGRYPLDHLLIRGFVVVDTGCFFDRSSSDHPALTATLTLSR